jgi:hypothetical protein
MGPATGHRHGRLDPKTDAAFPVSCRERFFISRGTFFVIPMNAPCCHSEEYPLVVIPRSTLLLSFRGIPSCCHSEERSDEESLPNCHHFPPFYRLQIPRFARDDTVTGIRDDTGKGIRKDTGKGIRDDTGKGIRDDTVMGIRKDTQKGMGKQTGRKVRKDTLKGMRKHTESGRPD